jgi:hypothetical protein
MQDNIDRSELVPQTYGIDFYGIFRSAYDQLAYGGWDSFLGSLERWWIGYSIIAILFSIFFFGVFIYAKIRYSQLHEIQELELQEAEAKWAARHETAGSKNARWEAIRQKVTENNPESWRLAIIEADILLEETLNNAGYVGQTLGEKLKSANVQSFTTIQDAWEAHKVRNEIAHVGSDFVLTQKSARETILRFERTFREFGVI